MYTTTISPKTRIITVDGQQVTSAELHELERQAEMMMTVSPIHDHSFQVTTMEKVITAYEQTTSPEGLPIDLLEDPIAWSYEPRTMTYYTDRDGEGLWAEVPDGHWDAETGEPSGVTEPRQIAGCGQFNLNASATTNRRRALLQAVYSTTRPAEVFDRIREDTPGYDIAEFYRVNMTRIP